MLIFDENTMMKAKFTTSFVLSDEMHGIAVSDGDGNIDDGEYEFIDTKEGQECWVICGIFCETYKDQAMVFVYIPDIDFATCVLSNFVLIGS